MAEVELVGVPFDGYGRQGNQARASAALRDAGLARALRGHRVVDSGDLELPAPDPRRGDATGLLNEAALVAVADGLEHRVGGALRARRFPLVHGGDCTTLLGTVPAARSSAPGAGLVVVDGHEDTIPLDVSEDGEAANTEVGLLLGLTGGLLRGPLHRRVGVLDDDALALLGPRDAAWRRRFNVGSLRDRGTWCRDLAAVAPDPAGAAVDAVRHVSRASGAWWFHVDLDVLDPVELPAQGLPDVDDEPGGLTWDQLTDLAVAAVGAGGCLGWSIAIYDPDQDPGGTGASRIVELVRDVAAALP